MLNLDSLSFNKVSRQSDYTNCYFSILIPSWNNLEFLKLCLTSLEKNSSLKNQIIVLINEGSDGTLNYIKEETSFDFIYFNQNVGICYAMNGARSLIKCDYVLYLNDDMYVLPNWDKELKKNIENEENPYFMFSSTMIEPSGSNPSVIVKDFGNTIENFKEDELLKSFDKLEKSDWFGSTWPPNVMPTILWDLVGGLSIEYSPGMYSDPDFSMKLWKLGVRNFRGIGKSRVYHFGSKSTKRISTKRGRDIFLRKWGVTAKFFAKNFLKRGEKFNYKEKMTEPKINFFSKVSNFFKMLISKL